MRQLSFNPLVIVIFTAAILAIFPITGFSMPKDAIGKVVALRGTAIALQPDSKSRILSLKSPVFKHDTIKTTQGRLQLMFKDNTLITLGRNTEMSIEEYLWKSNDPDSTMKTRIKAGSFRVMGGAITRDAPQNFKTHAPSATIGIRGSMYAGIVKGNFLSVVFQGGKGIYVANMMGSVEIDRPGYGTIVSGADQAPEKPKKFDEKTLKEIEGELAASDNEKEEKTTEKDKSSNTGDNQEETASEPEKNTSENIASNTPSQTNTTTSIPGIIAESITDKTDETRELQTQSEEEKDPVNTDPTDTDPTDTDPTDTDPTDTDPTDTDPTDTDPTDTDPTDTDPTDTDPTDTDPTDTDPTDTDPTDTDPTDTDPTDTDPTDTDPTDTDPTDTDPTDTDPTDTDPTDTDPTDTDPTVPVTEEEKTILSLLEKQGFSGQPSSSIPSSGIWRYTGEIRDNNTEITYGSVFVYVNWDNQRFFAVDGENNNPDMDSFGFAFGEITDTGEITNVHVLGSGSNNDFETIIAMTGSETFGQFYGINQEAAGIFLEGYDINVQDQSDTMPWSDSLTVLLDEETSNPNSGIANWNGFYIGVGEDMNDPNTDRVLFVNSDSDEFKLTIDKDAGTFFGNLSGKDFLGTGTQINSLTLGGGTNESVYVTDKKIAAFLGGTNVISNSSGSIDLKSAGNFMVSSMDTPLSENTNWGYWEIAYEEPGTGKDYHVHVPGSLWIAGEQTTESAMSNLIATSFLAIYTGKAQGVKFDDTSQMTNLTNGQTELTIEFDSASSRPVYGTISFDEVTLPITSSMGDVTGKGFKGEISSATTSRLNGTYFGSNAQGIGGNFSAIMPDGNNYLGIFAGDR